MNKDKIVFTKGTALKLISGELEFYMAVDVHTVSLAEIQELFENEIEYVSVEINQLFKDWAQENMLSELREMSILFHRKLVLTAGVNA
ncbi:hypothetical protein FP76_gp097 [Bacillus phage Evoli]|uniref:Uncharacterized protein n=1 Tax=Bacillus phage Evoli TaxID=1486658 RepID=A0A024B0S3_9CAUD|nr:hypothetical protein FP76_gp097 [Bacillus phage Evoli]AHZ09997.1 hypothetical protein [Bacillus phage Evoli]